MLILSIVAILALTSVNANVAILALTLLFEVTLSYYIVNRSGDFDLLVAQRKHFGGQFDYL